MGTCCDKPENQSHPEPQKQQIAAVTTAADEYRESLAESKGEVVEEKKPEPVVEVVEMARPDTSKMDKYEKFLAELPF